MDNNDPDQNGRCQVYIYGVHPQELKESPSELPWVMPKSLSDYKNGFATPQLGELVNIEFENEDINYPKYTTKVHTKTAISDTARKGYPDTVVLFEYGEYSFVLNRKTGELKFQMANSASVTIDKEGEITLDNHLAVSGNDLVGIMSPPSAKELAQESLAELQNKIANGSNINIRTSGTLNLEAPKLNLGGGSSQIGSQSTPNINPLNNVGLNCINFCPFSGMPHITEEANFFYSSALNSVEKAFTRANDIK